MQTGELLIETKLGNRQRSLGAAYVLLVLLGGFGAHRLYLGKKDTGLIMLVLGILSWVTLGFGVGLVIMVGLLIWCIVDLFLVPRMREEQNNAIRAEIEAELE